jgi:hypothetical protein
LPTAALAPEDALISPSVEETVRELDRRSFDPRACRTSAERFSEQQFIGRFDQVLAEEFERARR